MSEARTHYRGLYGSAPPMQLLYGLLDRIAPTDSTVFIEGENGTGKELVARAIHDSSPRAHKPFVVINCSAFNDALLDSEMFGHRRGAFTGAVSDKLGLFEVADGGTLFLDEIGDMSPTLQVKVLRVLQDGSFLAVGDTEPRAVDVRIVCATHRNLQAMVAAGSFREDLFFRIHVISLEVPPLRERPGDIGRLLDRFLDQRSGGHKLLAPAARAALERYAWPGNVRELENEVERLVVLSGREPQIEAELISPRIRRALSDASPAPVVPETSLPAAVAALERRMIGEALHRHQGNKTRAASELRVSRRNLIRLAQKYQLG